ncbi:hypothetical protein PC111_g12817 [Phytophthora cactorum]|nr:hypothetical protein PC111_g12817 [Phytophthora cactorum]KAG3146699.1 hypothetical protein C6341_g17945 [Phytophthora cactorum]KAG3181190.1 hypothetical protein PC128_g15267 [Phytophthora cactorum]
MGSEPKDQPKLRTALHVGKLHYDDKMSSSSDSDDNRRKSKKDKFHINSHGNPVHWGGENWPFYKKSMTVAFQKSLLE